MNNKLTIILTLKGRFNFTRRWLDWAISRKCPFKILIADGGLDDSVRLYLSTLKPNNLNLEYIRYPPDLTLKEWFAKISDVTQRVETKYVINTDNDDFLFFERLASAIEEMERNEGTRLYTAPYYCMSFNRGNSKNIAIDALVRPKNGIFFSKAAIPNSNFSKYCSKSLMNRFEYVLSALPSAFLWYGIHLSSEHHKTHSTILNGGVSLAMIEEWYFSYRAVIKNSIYYNENSLPYLVRQMHTSETVSVVSEPESPKRIFLRRSWSDDLDFMIRALYEDAVGEGLIMPFADFELFFKKHFEIFFLKWSRFSYLSLLTNKYIKAAKYVYRAINSWRYSWRERTRNARCSGDPELIDLKHFLVNYSIDEMEPEKQA
jgi:glycosyltransferase domain-containing protein